MAIPVLIDHGGNCNRIVAWTHSSPCTYCNIVNIAIPVRYSSTGTRVRGRVHVYYLHVYCNTVYVHVYLPGNCVLNTYTCTDTRALIRVGIEIEIAAMQLQYRMHYSILQYRSQNSSMAIPTSSTGTGTGTGIACYELLSKCTLPVLQ